MTVEQARLTHLAYAPEIAQAMLRRQQAEAVIAARRKIVMGATSMVEMALNELSEKHVVEFDEERKAAMISNLMVVLCGESQVTPVVNTGTRLHVTRGRGRRQGRRGPPISRSERMWRVRRRMSAMAARKQYLLRVDPALWAEVEKWAADELRSVNAQVEIHPARGGAAARAWRAQRTGRRPTARAGEAKQR